MENENKRVIEISGVKLEIDLRNAKRLDTFRVGDRVKVLVKEYTDRYSTHYGVIVSFDNFQRLPTITVCYITTGYNADVKFAYLNAKSEDIEIVACDEAAPPIVRTEILGRLQTEIDKKNTEIDDIARKMNYFKTCFGKLFGESQPE